MRDRKVLGGNRDDGGNFIVLIFYGMVMGTVNNNCLYITRTADNTVTVNHIISNGFF